jgi:hypothetical protein
MHPDLFSSVLCAELAGSGRAGAGAALEVCASGKPGAAGKEGGDVFQVDRRLNMMIDLQLFSQIPLAHVKE